MMVRIQLAVVRAFFIQYDAVAMGDRLARSCLMIYRPCLAEHDSLVSLELKGNQ